MKILFLILLTPIILFSNPNQINIRRFDLLFILSEDKSITNQGIYYDHQDKKYFITNISYTQYTNTFTKLSTNLISNTQPKYAKPNKSNLTQKAYTQDKYNSNDWEYFC